MEGRRQATGAQNGKATERSVSRRRHETCEAAKRRKERMGLGKGGRGREMRHSHLADRMEDKECVVKIPKPTVRKKKFN